jgi:hypothetical protein
MRGAACKGIGLSALAILFREHQPSFYFWHSEHVNAWCSKPETHMVSSWATLTRIISPQHAIQRIARTPTNLTRTTSAFLTVALARASGRAALRLPLLACSMIFFAMIVRASGSRCVAMCHAGVGMVHCRVIAGHSDTLRRERPPTSLTSRTQLDDLVVESAIRSKLLTTSLPSERKRCSSNFTSGLYPCGATQSNRPAMVPTIMIFMANAPSGGNVILGRWLKT